MFALVYFQLMSVTRRLHFVLPVAFRLPALRRTYASSQKHKISFSVTIGVTIDSRCLPF